MKRLTKNEEAYCIARSKGLTQRQAYREAYPNNKQKDDFVDAKASLLEKKEKIQKRLNQLRDKFQRKNILSVEEILNLLSKDATDVNLKAKDKHNAMDMLLKALGAYSKTVNLNGQVDVRVEDLLREAEGDEF